MRRSHSNLSEAIGTDAFLDIVANLVGILLILLMVIGVRMEDASKTVQPVTTTPVSTPPASALVEFEEVAIPNGEEFWAYVKTFESEYVYVARHA